MNVLRVKGGRSLRGRIRVPGDKSISHRALILAALAEGTSRVRGLSHGDDVARTRQAVEALGTVIDGERITGGRSRLHSPAADLDVGNSGTSIRLLAGVCAGLPWRTVLFGDESIARRPMDRVVEPLRSMGASVDGTDRGRYPPLTIEGGDLRGIDYTPPVASAQVKSCVLLAGLTADGETIVREPVPTRAHTEELLTLCRADVHIEDGGHTVRLRASTLEPFELVVAGDPSQAAFWIVGACVVPGSDLIVEGIYLGAVRTGFLEVLQRMGAQIEVDHDAGTVRARYGPLVATNVHGSEISGLDEIPILAVAAALADGTTTIVGAGELRVKESDRIATVTSELGAMGASIEAHEDGLVIEGPARLAGTHVHSHGDHRIGMSLAIAALAASGETVIDGWDAVATSYLGFEAELARCAS
jgi:3-phosphoshikimate 1-carboxyvinyltransferase